MTEIALRRTAKAKKPVYLDARANDQLLEMVLVLAQELSVTQDKLDSLARLVAAEGVLDLEQLAEYRPDDAVAAERSRRRAEMLARLTRSLEGRLSQGAEAAGD